MAIVGPRPYKLDDIKSKLLRPALTSHFQFQVNIPPSLSKWYSDKRTAFSQSPDATFDQELINLSCCDATLPGSTLYTHDVTDYTGVTEKIPYRRVYDDRADFTFYVDSNYEVIKFFEFWMQYIVDEQYVDIDNLGLESKRYSYRINYPDGNDSGDRSQYRTNISLTKFERDYGGLQGQPNSINRSKNLSYVFIDAYPMSIMSMPVSYEASQVLKCTVSFAYTRYIVSSSKIDQIVAPNPTQQTPKFGPAFGTDQEFFNGLNRR